MNFANNASEFFTILSYGGLVACSIMILAALLERSLFGLLFARRVKRESSALGLIDTLKWVATVAPMFGILGTVSGIMQAFAGEGLEPGVLLNGISTSLWTTGLGLLAGIVAFTSRQMFLAMTERALLRVEEAA